MKIGIVDADLIGRSKHRFPNLACEKISAYHKENGDYVRLILSYDEIERKNQFSLFQSKTNEYDKIYISKVFTDTPVPDWIDEAARSGRMETCEVAAGGTGFFFDKAKPLPKEVEHHKPDYSLYDEWIETYLRNEENTAKKQGKCFDRNIAKKQFKSFTDYSIGFATRGCFRKCEFCVNQNSKKVAFHSDIKEFYDPTRNKICLLDDNILAYSKWRNVFEQLNDTGKSFVFKQGLDVRLLTDEKCKILFNSKYDGDFLFAFDSMKDYDLIERKLAMIRKHTSTERIRFYVLCGFESTDGKDIEGVFQRVRLLMKYKCIPYIMRYQSVTNSPWKDSKYSGMYTALARWTNQPQFFKKLSFREFVQKNQEAQKNGSISATLKSANIFEMDNPGIAKEYFDLSYEDFA